MKLILILFVISLIFLSGCITDKNLKECSKDLDCKGKLQARCLDAPDPICVKGKCELPATSKCFSPLDCISDSDCTPAGCSSEVCTTNVKAEDLVTTCEYKEEYSCLQKTSCGCVENKCVWKDTQEYKNCLTNLPKSEKVY